MVRLSRWRMPQRPTVAENPSAQTNAMWVERIAAVSLMAQQLAELMLTEARELTDKIRPPRRKTFAR